MSETILNLLTSSDPNQRKRGIGEAAKSLDTRYLKSLAVIVKTDPDPDLRQLAKKAGIYINKNRPQPTPNGGDDLTALRDEALATMPADNPASPPEPAPASYEAPSIEEMLPVNVPADGEVDPEQAEYHYNAAFDIHLKGGDARAALELGTAFRLNPAYATDPTAVAFAAELTGKPTDEAAAYIADPANWREMTDNLGGIKRIEGERSWVGGISLWVAGGVAALVLLFLGIAFVQGELFAAALEQVLGDVFGGLFGDDSVFSG